MIEFYLTNLNPDFEVINPIPIRISTFGTTGFIATDTTTGMKGISGGFGKIPESAIEGLIRWYDVFYELEEKEIIKTNLREYIRRV
jgi:hypothetical protein